MSKDVIDLAFESMQSDCQGNSDGYKLGHVNGFLAAATPREELIAELVGALEALTPILEAAESNASGNPEWPWVSKRIDAARAAIANAEGRP